MAVKQTADDDNDDDHDFSIRRYLLPRGDPFSSFSTGEDAFPCNGWCRWWSSCESTAGSRRWGMAATAAATTRADGEEIGNPRVALGVITFDGWTGGNE